MVQHKSLLRHLEQSAIVKRLRAELYKEQMVLRETQDAYEYDDVNVRKVFKPELAKGMLDEVVYMIHHYGKACHADVTKREEDLRWFEAIMERLNIKCSHRLWETSYIHFENRNQAITSLGNSLAPLLYTITLSDFVEKYKDIDELDILPKLTYTKEEYRYLNYCVMAGEESIDLARGMAWVEHYNELTLALYDRNQELQEFMVKA